MRVSYQFGDVLRSPSLIEHIEKKVDKVGRLIPNTSEDLVHLQVGLEKINRKEEYRLSLNMHFPGKTLHAEETSDNAMTSATEAFEDLIRQVKTYKRKLSGRHLHRPKNAESFSEYSEVSEPGE
jgi:putative sigma-54 modulation protein